MMRFASPWMFLLLAAIPAVYLWARRGKGPLGWSFPSLGIVRASGASLRQHFLPLVPAMRALALALIVVALARPQFGTEKIRDISRGIAEASIPTTLFEGRYVHATVTLANYDQTVDSSRFLMVTADVPPPPRALRVTLGWSNPAGRH